MGRYPEIVSSKLQISWQSLEGYVDQGPQISFSPLLWLVPYATACSTILSLSFHFYSCNDIVIVHVSVIIVLLICSI